MTRRTNDELSEGELTAMEVRSEAASPGPWLSLVVGRDMEAGLNCIVLGCASAIEVLGGTVEDQDFIANAREDVSRLIREVRWLKAKVDLQSALLAAASAEIDLSRSGECGVPALLDSVERSSSILKIELHQAAHEN